jgi:hypothetical protein
MPAEMTSIAPTSPPPKHRFWRIHLSTAVVMMLACSILLYANSREGNFMYARTTELEHGVEYGDFIGSYYGWPYPCYWWMHDRTIVEPIIAANALVALSITIAVAITCEFLVRRRPKP